MVDSRRLKEEMRSKLKAKPVAARKGYDHDWWQVRDDDGTVLGLTKFSHGGREDLGNHLLDCIASQLGLPSARHVRELACVRCPGGTP